MANALKQYRERFGLSTEQLADDLSGLLGRPVKVATVERNETGRSRIPKSWVAALGLEAGPEPEPADTQGPAGIERDVEPPRAPGPEQEAPRLGPPSAAAPPGELGLVRDRIAKAYAAIGAGASMLTHNDGYAAVADSYSRDLAAAWEAAAKENANVRRIVEFMESGGPVGELVVAHLILVGGFVYVSGRGPALDFLYAGKFSGYRNVAAARIAEADAEAELNGSAAVDPSRLVADAQG